MKIIYNSKLLAWLQRMHLCSSKIWSITIAEWVLTNRSDLTEYSIKHERCHVRQWRWHLYIFFPIVYYLISLFTGYWNHPYERMARRYAGQEDEFGNISNYGYD